MNTSLTKLLLSVLIIIVLHSGCAIQKTSSNKYSGDWAFYASTGTSGTIRITNSNSDYDAILITNYGEKPITNFNIIGKHIIGDFEIMGTNVHLEGDFKGNHLSGALKTESRSETIQADKVVK